MAHPHAHTAKESSRSKYKSMMGKKGGGHTYNGASMGKRYAHGGYEHYDGHHERFEAEKPEMRAFGGKAKKRLDRYARGGKTKPGVNVAIVMPHGAQGAPPMPMRPPLMPPRPPVGLPPGGPPPGGPPGLPPPPPGLNPMAGPVGGLPGGPGLPPRKSGGRTYKRGGRAEGGRTDAKGDYLPGESNQENLRNWQGYASRNSYARGGNVDSGGFHKYPHMKAGATTGVGRLEEAHDQRKRRHGKA